MKGVFFHRPHFTHLQGSCSHFDKMQELTHSSVICNWLRRPTRLRERTSLPWSYRIPEPGMFERERLIKYFDVRCLYLILKRVIFQQALKFINRMKNRHKPIILQAS